MKKLILFLFIISIVMMWTSCSSIKCELPAKKTTGTATVRVKDSAQYLYSHFHKYFLRNSESDEPKWFITGLVSDPPSNNPLWGKLVSRDTGFRITQDTIILEAYSKGQNIYKLIDQVLRIQNIMDRNKIWHIKHPDSTYYLDSITLGQLISPEVFNHTYEVKEIDQGKLADDLSWEGGLILLDRLSSIKIELGKYRDIPFGKLKMNATGDEEHNLVLIVISAPQGHQIMKMSEFYNNY